LAQNGFSLLDVYRSLLKHTNWGLASRQGTRAYDNRWTFINQFPRDVDDLNFGLLDQYNSSHQLTMIAYVLA